MERYLVYLRPGDLHPTAVVRATDAQQTVEALQRERDEARDFLNTVTNDLNEQAAALDAEASHD